MTRPASTGERISRSVAVLALALAAVAVGGCASSFIKAERAAAISDWDGAVAYYTKSVQEKPDCYECRVGLKRALENAAVAHLEKGRIAEARLQLDEALREYRRAGEFDGLNGEVTARTRAVEQKIRDQIEARRPKGRAEQLREKARQAAAEPPLNPASRQPLDITFNNASVRDILNFIGQSTGINVTFERDAVRPAEQGQYTVQLHGVTLEQALFQILTANGFFYKVMDPHTIMVIQDVATKRMLYEEQAIQTFYLSHTDASELMTVLQAVTRLPGMTNPPAVQVNKTANTIIVRGSAPFLRIIEQVIEANDKPRAELLIDVEVLEVNRNRIKQYGLDLNSYSLNLVFSPEAVPEAGATSSGLFNLNSLSGVNKGDFYLSVPAATIRLLESDADTRIVAKPQLRGSEGEKLTLNLGQQIPVPNTTFGASGAGGVNTIPISSFNLKDIGLNFEITPRVTFENDIILTLTLENSTYLGNINTAGQDLPSFGQRKVGTRLRLRDGEPNLLAGLLATNDSYSVKGIPGLVHIPGFKQIFSYNNNQTQQTDIVMLLTPHIIRSHEFTERDVSPVYIGTQQNVGLTGAPPLIAAPGEAGAAGEQPPAGLTPPGTPPAGQPGAQPPGAAPGAPVPAAPAQPGQPPGAPAQPAGAQPPPAAAAAQPGGAAAVAPLVAVTASGPDFRVGGGPYTIPITISSATGVSTLTLTLRFNPAVLKVRNVQEGSFMRQGSANATFAQQVDPAGGRIDLTLTRTGDATGASGAGLVAAVLFDAVAPGSATLAISGVASGPAANPIPLQFSPATVTVK